MFEILGINFHLYGLILGVAVWIAMEIALKKRGDIKKDILEKAMMWTVVFGVIGARIYHVIDYWDKYYSINLNRIFYFWEGGLGIWGAIVGGIFGLIIFCYFNKLKIIRYLDILILGMPLAQTIGRLGNYVNGELYGKNGEPLFAYEGVLNLVLFFILWKFSQKKYKPGMISGIYFLGYGTIRIVLENIRPYEAIWRVFDIPVAVLLGIVAVSVGIFLIFRKKQF